MVFGNDLQNCFFKASMFFLVALNVLVLIQIFEQIEKENNLLLDNQVKLTNTLHSEYKRIHDLKCKREKVLLKTKYRFPNDEKILIYEEDLAE